MADDFDKLPPRLLADLKRAVDRPVEIPPTTDATIRLMARRRLGGRRWWIGGAVGAAAVAAMVLVVVNYPSSSSRPMASDLAMAQRKASPMDIDASGRVDILDAYVLAKQLPTGQDLTGDGKVDQADVEAIARVAVNLKGGARP